MEIQTYMTDNQKKVIEPSNVVELPDDIKPEDFPDLLEQTLITFNDGDVIEGTIVRIDRNEVMVDVGYKSEGVIPSRELSVRKSVNPKDLVNEGDKIQALVLDKEDDEGRLILSVKRAIYEKAWGDIQEISDNDKSVKGTVISELPVIAKDRKPEAACCKICKLVLVIAPHKPAFSPVVTNSNFKSFE